MEPLARRAVAQGRHQRQHPGRAGAAPRLRRRRAAGAGRARRAGLPHRRAHLLSPWRARAGRAPRGAAGAGAHAGRRAPASGRPAPTRWSCSTTRRGSAPRCCEEAEEVARAAREETDERVDEEAADVLYHLLVLLRSRGRDAGRRRAGARWPSPLHRWMPGPSREAGSRALAREYNLIPLRHSFIADCETPVSAFLKLRALAPGEPAFLLESAEQGQRVGRYSFIGFRPRRWCAGRWPTAATPTRSPRPRSRATARRRCRGLPPFAGGAVGYFGYDLVRTVEPLAEPNPDPLGLPDMALMLSDVLVVFDHLKHTVTVLAHVARQTRPRRGAYEAAATRSPRSAPRSPARCRRRARGARSGAPRDAGVQPEHGARAASRRWSRASSSTCTPGDAFQVVPSQRWSAPVEQEAVLDLPRACARSTRAPTCTSWTSATSRSPAPAPSRCSRSAAADVSTRPIAGTRPRGAERRGGSAHRRRAAGRREGARRARDARRPRPQRPRAGVRVRQRERRPASWRSRPTAT